MKRQTVNRLLASVAITSLCCAGIDQARAQVTVGEPNSTSITTVTTPIATATANNGAPDDVVIEGGVSYAIPNGTVAITLNSNNYVNNAGSIGAFDVSNTAAILIQGGYTGYLTSSGTIALTDSNISNVVPLTPGVDRFGIQVQGSAPFNGYIDVTEGSITIRGNNSAGIFIAPGITGDLTSGGAVSVVGNNSYGILATGPMGGNVIQTAIMEVLGTGTTGISLQSVGGQVLIQSQLQSTGYLDQTRPTTTAGFAALGPNDVLQGGPALVVQGSVGAGVVVDTAGVVQSYGAAPAILLGPITGVAEIGPGDVAPDAYGLLVRGSVQANGIYDSFNVTGVQVGGTGGTVIVDGGIRVTGGVQVNAFAANATAIQISPGASVSALINNGTISAEVQGGGTTATGAVGGNASAIVDSAGTLRFIQNTGIIATLVAPGFTGAAVTGNDTALDLRANTTGVTVTQSPSGTTTPPSITGNVLFGSGNSNLNLLAGTLAGNVSFGTGINSFIVNGGQMTGALTTANGNLNLNVASGLLTLTNANAIGLTTLQIGSSGEIDFNADPAHGQITHFIVSGTTNLSVGAKIGIDFTSKLTQATSYTLVQSGGGSLTSVQPQIGDLPYFYTGTLNANPAGTITLNLAPRTASQAGLTVGSAAYNAIFGAFDRDPNIYSSFNGALTRQNFAKLYEQMLPDYAGGLFEALADASDTLSQSEARRPLVLGSNRDGYWAQQIGFGATENRDAAPGYRAGGIGLAFGWETAESSAGTFGVSGTYLLANVDDRDAGPYNHVSGTVYVLGGYWRDSIGGFRTDASVDLGYTGFSSEREFNGTDPTGAAFTKDASASWSGALAHGHVGISDEEKIFGDFFVRPEVSASYFALYQDGHTERNGGSAFDLTVASGTGKQGSAKAGVTVGAHIDDPFFSWTPEVSVDYREVVGGPGDTVAQFSSGGSSFNLSPESLPGHGFDASVGLHGGNRFSDVGFEANGEFRGDYHSFGGAFVARFHL